MGSRGSVIPLFIDQIKRGEPLTITDPDMTRFMMSLPMAVDLVLFAFKYGNPGDTFVQKAPAATIEVLVQALQKLFCSNNEIKLIGTRHGEKKFETLLSREEMLKAEDLGGYFRVPADTRDLNYSLYFEKGEKGLSTEIEYNSDNTKRLNIEEMSELLLNLDFVQKELKG
jgi:UDP-glucose 4-epimerase